ncbi:MAG: GNAT family N-acetyltransferase [Gammaproteobacteria bacterium]|nr:GNAT family N-acetyltransferase [Gammaproteobacteria bacterium]
MNASIPQLGSLSSELAIRIEQVEAEMWKQYWSSVSPSQAFELGMHHEVVGSGVALMMEKIPNWFFNRVIGLGIDTAVTLDQIHYLQSLYRNKGLPLGISFSPHAQPSNLPHSLEEMGFENALDWVKMVRGVQAPMEVKTDLRIEPVAPHQWDTATDVLLQGFEMPPMLRPMFASVLGNPQNHIFMMWDGDKAVALGILSLFDGIGHLNSAATLPEYRGRGAQGALMAQRIKHGIELGCELFVTETGYLPDQKNPSLQNMIRNGFELAYMRPNYVVNP